MKRLGKAQKEALLQWVAEGLETGEINKRAEKFDPPFSVSRQQVDHYRKTRATDIKEITQAGEKSALNSGVALREVRMGAINELFEELRRQVRESMWITDAKGINGELVYVEKFNEPLVRQYRETIAQAQDEAGDKKPEAVPATDIRVTFAPPERKP